jgi:hypothetical protein
MNELPSAVQEMFTARSEDSAPDRAEREVPQTETQRPEAPTVVANTAENQDVDRFVRQRDAVIRDKQKLAAEVRELRGALEAARKPAEVKVEPPKPVAPDPKVNPVGYLEFQRKQDEEKLRSEIEAAKAEYTEKFERMEYERTRKEALNHILSEEQQFRQRQPDYDDAMRHFDKASMEHLLAQGNTDEEAISILDGFKQKLFVSCLQVGVPVAEAFYYHALQAGWNASQATVNATKSNDRAPMDRQVPSSLSAAGRGASTASPDGRSRITLDQFRQLPPGDPMRLRVSGDRNLFRILTEQGEVSI